MGALICYIKQKHRELQSNRHYIMVVDPHSLLVRALLKQDFKIVHFKIIHERTH